MKRVLTYTDPFGLAAHPQVKGLLDNTLHVCATVSLRKGMDDQYGKHLPFVEVQELVDALLPNWMADRTRVSQLARLSELCEQYRNQPPGAPLAPERWAPHMRAFIRNMREALLAMRVLAEAGIHPGDLKPTTADEQFFCFLWDRLEASERSFARVRERLEVTFADPAALQKAFEAAIPKALNSHGERPLPMNKGQIIFHGFYFITPIQMRLINWCEAAGYEVLFLNNWDPRVPEAFLAWDALFRPEHGLPGRADWALPEPCSRPVPVGELFAGKEPTAPINARIIQHDAFGALVRQVVEEVDDPERPTLWYTPEADLLNRFLREYRPGRAEEQDRHFLAYPVGQMLLHLHRLWDRETGELRLQARSLIECFASGWLHVNGVNAKPYVRALEAMLPFFAGCDTLAEWEERAQALLDVRQSVVPLFQHPSLAGSRNARFHRFLHNPLERLAHFGVAEADVRTVVSLMKRLFFIASSLFGPGRVALGEHFRKVERLLLDGADESQLLYSEKRLLQGLRERMDELADEPERFLAGDLAIAVSFYLGGELQKSPDEPTEGAILEYAQLDGAPLQARRRNLPIHLCLLGETSLPKRKSAFPWPLSEQTFAHMPHHPLVRLLVLREAESANADRYLLHYALTWTDEVVLSWAAAVAGEAVGPSPYLVLLEPYCRKSISALQPFSPGRRAHSEPAKASSPARVDQWETFPPDALVEHAICPRRFYYSFLAQEAPAFSSDFHHGFQYGNLVKGLAQVSRRRPEEVAPHVNQLFPQWTGFVRQQDQLERTPAPSAIVDRYDGSDYPRARLGMQLLAPLDAEMQPAVRLLDEEHGIDLQAQELGKLNLALADGQAVLPAHPLTPRLCRFCPHNGRCADAHYPIDDEEEGR
jgi:hypothetical protein